MANQSAGSVASNLIIVLLLGVVTLLTAYQECYLVCDKGLAEILRTPFWAAVAGGLALAVVLAWSISTRRLLSLVVVILFIEVVNQSLATRLGLWKYTAASGSYVFGLCIWVVAGLAAYTVAGKAVVPLTRWLNEYVPRLVAPLIVIVLILVVWVMAPRGLRTVDIPKNMIWLNLYWLFLAFLVLVGFVASVKAGAGVVVGIVIAAWIVGFISESAGATAGIWYFPEQVVEVPVAHQMQGGKISTACPPPYLVLGCWPLEILAQIALAALLAAEAIVPPKGPGTPGGDGSGQGTSEPDATVAGSSIQGGCPGSGERTGGQGNPTGTNPHGCHRSPGGNIPDWFCREDDPDAELTDEERELKGFMQFSFLLYLVAGLIFALFPERVIYLLEDLSRFLSAPRGVAADQNKFWVSMTFSMMMAITFLSFYVQYNVRKNKNYVVPLMVAKSSTAISALFYFAFCPVAGWRYQPYLAIFLVDGVLFWLTLHFYIRANKAFLDAQTVYHREDLETVPWYGPKTVAVFSGGDKKKLLDKVLDATAFDSLLETAFGVVAQTKKRDTFSVVIKPNFMFAHHKNDRSTFTDPELVDHLVERIWNLGFRNISLVESQTTLENYYGNRSVQQVALYLGFTNPKYKVVNLTQEKVCHDYGGNLGYHYIGPTWRDADFRISFAKNKTHVFSSYTLTLKNIYGTLPVQNKLKAYHAKREYDWPTIETLKPENCRVHYGLIDAYLSADGQFGVITDPEPNMTKTIIGGDDLVAVDWVGAKKMGLDPEDIRVGRFHYLAVKAFGRPRVKPVGDADPLAVYKPWENVSLGYIRFLDIIEEAYHLSNWGFSILSNQDPNQFPFKVTSPGVRFLRSVLKPIKRRYYGY